MISYVLNNCTH